MSANPRDNLAHHWFITQKVLFPHMIKTEGPLSEHHKQLITVIEFVRVEKYIPYFRNVGRPPEDRRSVVKAFIAKSVFNIQTTVLLREYLQNDKTLRRICGFNSIRDIPSLSTFSRAFKEIAEWKLLDIIHAEVIKRYQSEHLIFHISRDSTAIEAREKVDPIRKAEMKKEALLKKQKEENKALGAISQKKRGRPKKGESREPAPLKRLEKQVNQSLDEMLKELSAVCDIGKKMNSQGICIKWRGYKLHIDTANGGIPISVLLTSASVHDSGCALPLSRMTGLKVNYLYEIMDAAYDAEVIREDSLKRGHVPLIDFNRRNANDNRQFMPHEKENYNQRSASERMNARLKDEFGGRMIRVRGAMKVKAHLMFGIIAITVDQLVRLVQ